MCVCVCVCVSEKAKLTWPVAIVFLPAFSTCTALTQTEGGVGGAWDVGTWPVYAQDNSNMHSCFMYVKLTGDLSW